MEGLGLGDADLMMMAGSFIGWQPVVAALFIGTFPALLIGIFQVLRAKGQAMPFGPPLSLGVIVALLAWRPIGEKYELIFFDRMVLLMLLVFGSLVLLVVSFVLRLRGTPAELGLGEQAMNPQEEAAKKLAASVPAIAPASEPSVPVNTLVVPAPAIDDHPRTSVKPIVIVDYDMGNLRSVQKAFERFGHAAVISRDPNVVAEADKVVLPGVGAFRDAIARLRDSGLAAPVLEHLRQDKPLFGICLGLQLLFTTGHEDGVHQGLDFFHGEVIRFPDIPGLKVPHMGWNQLRLRAAAPPLAGTADGASVYFVHSYHAVPADRAIVAAETDYPTPFVSAICSGRCFATQFHPEKSQRVGLEMLRRFAAC
jgi:glutamine amidotransferase